MNQKKDIAIIGAGASGMLCSIIAKRADEALNITIFEKNDKVGKKILASGNGRCNITNRNLSKNNYYAQDIDFIDMILKQFDYKACEKFFQSIGLIFDTKDDGKTYPLSNEARSVTTLLENEINRLAIEVKLNHEVNSLIKKGDKFILDDQSFDKVVISSGLGAAPQLGSTQAGLCFAQDFGHIIKSTYASLVGLELNSKEHSKMFGAKTNAQVTLYINNIQEQQVSGDILFTKYGISGFAVLDISTTASYALSQGHDVQISLNLLPQFDRQKLFNLLSLLQKQDTNRSIEQILTGIIPNKIIPFITGKTIKQTVNNIQNMRFNVSDTHGFKHAEVSGGGVDIDKIDPKSMRSMLVDGLYFTGEVLDTVGQRGGYNFHFAWASGYICGKDLAK